MTAEGLMYHEVDTWTDRFGVTRSDVRVAHDVSHIKAQALLPVIPDGRWDYAISHQPMRSYEITHRYVFIPTPKIERDWLGDLCPWVRP